MRMANVNRFDFNSGGFKLEGWLHAPSFSPSVCVVISHGFGGYGDSPKWKFIASGLARAGFPALRFSHLGCGGSDGSFENCSLTARVADMNAAMDALTAETGARSFGLLGSSMGASTVLACASQPRVKATITLAAPADFSFFPKMINNATPDERGNIVVDGREIRASVVEDFDNFNPVALAMRAKRLFVIHGGGDDLIPFSDADILYNAAPEPKKSLIVPGADHPFTEPAHQRILLDESIAWFKKHLAPEPLYSKEFDAQTDE